MTIILLILALLCFVGAAAGLSFGRVSLTPLGLALLTVYLLVVGGMIS